MSPNVLPADAPLTALAAGAGCGCKLPAATLLPLVLDLPADPDPRVLVGTATGDDAAVVALSDELAIVQTVDFFPPLVDDPYDFGRIAAANALSDVYAMGAAPVCALNVVAVPLSRLGAETLGAVLQGGLDVLSAAGASLVGGHSIEDPEPKYGLAVTGTVHPQRFVSNAGGRPGDALVLTKPLGTGAVVAAAQRGRCDAAVRDRAIATMTTLNADAACAAVAAGVHAMTDVTGFGLLGHTHNLARESGLAAAIDATALPAIAGVEPLLRTEDGQSGGSRRNADWATAFTVVDPAVPPWRRRLAADAQTSGGLLVALGPGQADAVPGTRVGTLEPGAPGTIRLY